MATQEPPHDANPSPAQMTPDSSLNQPTEEAGEAKAEQQETPVLLVETRVQIEIEKDAEKSEPGVEKLLLKAERYEVKEIASAEHVLHEAEEEARHLIAEAGTHETVQLALLEAKTFGNFWLKFLNDWVFNFSSGLAYHLLTAMFPVVIVILLIVGFLSRNNQDQLNLLHQLNAIFPNELASQNVLAPALSLIRKDAGFLGVLAILLAVFNGSRLFITIEDCFDIIYHTRARPFWQQNLMAILMLLAFIVLIPVMLLASSVGWGGFIWGLAASWLLFEAIYLFVPNQHISLRNSWLGALIAAGALQIYIAIFPLYVRHFLGSYTGNAGFAIILLLFFYYFAIILLLGAEVNAYYSEDIRGNPTNIAGLVHQATLAADKQKQAELARKKDELRALKR